MATNQDATKASLRDERLAVAALSLGAFAMALNSNVMGPLLPFLEPHLAGPNARFLIPSAPLAAAIGALLMGPVVDRFGRRPLLVAGMLLFVLASALHYLVDSIEWLIACRLLSGLAVGAVFTTASVAVAEIVPYQRRGAAMGTFNAGMYFALPIGMPAAQGLALLGDWRMAFIFQAVIGLFALLVFLRPLPGQGDRTSMRMSSPLEVLRQPMVVPALLSTLLVVGCFFTAVQYASRWMHDSKLIQKEDQMLVWVVLGLCAAIGSMVLTRFSDRIGKWRFSLLTAMGTAILLMLLARVDTMAGLWLVGVPMAIIASARSGPMQALVSDLVEPRMRGALMGIRAASVNLGTFAMSWIGGSIYIGQGYGAMLMFCGIGTVIAYLLVRIWVREPR